METKQGIFTRREQYYCPTKDRNVTMEISDEEGGEKVLHCLTEEQCVQEKGACTNSLREYWA